MEASFERSRQGDGQVALQERSARSTASSCGECVAVDAFSFCRTPVFALMSSPAAEPTRKRSRTPEQQGVEAEGSGDHHDRRKHRRGSSEESSSDSGEWHNASPSLCCCTSRRACTPASAHATVSPPRPSLADSSGSGSRSRSPSSKKHKKHHHKDHKVREWRACTRSSTSLLTLSPSPYSRRASPA